MLSSGNSSIPLDPSTSTVPYLPYLGFKECYEHIAKIKSYVNTHIHDLYEMFEELVVDLNVVCLPWVLSLLTSLVPL